jgi:hypothetical protein
MNNSNYPRNPLSPRVIQARRRRQGSGCGSQPMRVHGCAGNGAVAPAQRPAHPIVAAPEVCGNDTASVEYQQAHGKAGPSSVRLDSDVYRVWCVELFREDLVRRREGRAANYTPTAVWLCLARRDRRDLRPGPAPPACPYPTAATPPRDLAGPSPGHSRNRVLRSRPDRGSTPITRNKVCIKPSFNVNRFVGSPTPPRPGPGGLPPAATRSGSPAPRIRPRSLSEWSGHPRPLPPDDVATAHLPTMAAT